MSGADPGRLVVGVSLAGAGSTTIRFENGRAVDSTLAPIGSLSFAGQLQADVQ